MNIINTGSFPRVISYANGRNMRPGDRSPDVPITVIHNPLLWKDIGNGITAIRLSDADKAFIAQVQAADAKEIVVQQRTPPVVKAAPVAKEPAQAISATPVPEPTVVGASVLPIPASTGRPSLSDLKRMNAVGNSAKLTEIKQFMGGRV